jgi:hypothetical protein
MRDLPRDLRDLPRDLGETSGRANAGKRDLRDLGTMLRDLLRVSYCPLNYFSNGYEKGLSGLSGLSTPRVSMEFLGETSLVGLSEVSHV